MVSNLRSLRIVVWLLVPRLLWLSTLVTRWWYRWSVGLEVRLLIGPIVISRSTLSWPLERSFYIELLSSVSGEYNRLHRLVPIRRHPSFYISSQSLLELACLFLLRRHQLREIPCKPSEYCQILINCHVSLLQILKFFLLFLSLRCGKVLS